MIMSSDDDVPPLEDMEGLVDRIKELHADKPKFPSTPQKPLITTEAHVKHTAAKPASKQAGFGGMKKGFLFGGKPTTDAKVKAKKSPEKKIDYVLKASDDKNLVLDDVQKAMKEKSSNVLGKQEWLTSDLLAQLQNNTKLMRQMSDPRFSTAIEWMQKEPRKAIEYYKDDKEITEFFQEFSKVLGVHFSKLADANENQASSTKPAPESSGQHQPNKEDEEHMNKILADPEIRDILIKPDIQNLFTLLKTQPEKAQAMLQSSDPRMKADIQKLVSAGLLGIETR